MVYLEGFRDFLDAVTERK